MNSLEKIYQFTLVLKNVDENTPNLEDSLYEAGCDDALINFRNGTVYLDFDRKAASLQNAIMSAIKDVESGSIGAKVIHVAPENLVTEADIANRLSFKRQTVSLWIQGKRRDIIPFPKPVMKLSGKSPLWKWTDIVKWLYETRLISEQERVADAAFIENVNVVLEERDPETRENREKLWKEFEEMAHAY
ncbi:MAG: helix-turn-helix transcriptional regulator [Gammaproteobacteria bacterium]